MTRRNIIILVTALAAIVLAAVSIRSILSARRMSREFVYEEKQEAAPSPMIALVLDDFGYSRKNLEAIKAIKAPVTLAVLPGLRYSEEVCSFARDNSLEVILHLPMEPKDPDAPVEKNTVTVDMDRREVDTAIVTALISVPNAVGASNHMGSKATGDEGTMRVVFEGLKDRNMFFLDSFTTGDSVCENMARETGLSYAKRDIFLDHELDRGKIARQIEKLEEMAEAKGIVVAIGHDRAMTVEMLAEAVPRMKENGIRFVKLSEVIEAKEKQ